MYKQITIKNIKTFENEQKLNIAPLTLLYGENSSGKTTLLKSLDIVHNIFLTRFINRSPRGMPSATEYFRSYIFEDIKNISARKIHFFSSKLNKKIIKIEIVLNIPYRKISIDHPLISSGIYEDYEYFIEGVKTSTGKPKKTLSQKTFGSSIMIIDEMPNGSIRRSVLRRTQDDSKRASSERFKDNVKYQTTFLGSEKTFKSKEKVKLVPVKFNIELKYYRNLRVTKIKQITIKNFYNEDVIRFSRLNKPYNFINNEEQYGYLQPNSKLVLKRQLRDNPDFFTSGAGYADYKINLTKKHFVWKRMYKIYEKVFSKDKHVQERLKKIIFLLETLQNLKFSLIERKPKIDNESFIELVTLYTLCNNKTSSSEMEKVLKGLFIDSKIKFQNKINIKNVNKLLLQQFGKEIKDYDDTLVPSFLKSSKPEDLIFEPSWMKKKKYNYFTPNIFLKHPNALLYSEKASQFSKEINFKSIPNYLKLLGLLDKKVSFEKFSSIVNKSYQDNVVRFKRLPNIAGMGQRAEVRHSIVDQLGRTQKSSVDILYSFLNYISGDIPNMFKKFTKDGRRLNKIDAGFKRISPHHYLNNCISEIRKNVSGFIPCHPNKSENSYDVPMEEEFHIDEIEKAIGSIYDKRLSKSKELKKFFKKKGLKYKEIVVDKSEIHDFREIETRIKKMFPNQKIEREYNLPDIDYRADYLVTDSNNKKTLIEIKTILKKNDKSFDFQSLPEAITANGENFDDVVCYNSKLRNQLNKILKELLNLKIVVVSPEWLRNISEDALERLTEGWDRGSFRNLWSIRSKWPKKKKFIMLQDLTFKKFFNIHGREVGKGPSNILPFLGQILSDKPNLTFLIQELENNWHPKYQSKIIKTIVEIMKNSKNKNVILETHSELFILQIQKLIQKGILSKDDVSINYISRTSKGNSEVHYIPLNSQGGFDKPWPGGFFNERMEVLTS